MPVSRRAATLEHWNITNLMHGREADFKDREQLEKENDVDLNVQKWSIDNGAYLVFETSLTSRALIHLE